MRKIIILMILAAALIGGAAYFYKYQSVKEAAFLLAEPGTGEAVSSPLRFSGSAPGFWFFEATFPVHIADANGRILGSGYAQAEGDWMIAGPVKFSGEINFFSGGGFASGGDIPGTENGKIVFEKDNPSGLPENAGSFELPIKFAQFSNAGAPPFARMNLKVFFGNTMDSASSPQVLDCKKVFPVTRSVPQTLGVGRMALEQLLLGPTESEKKSGYVTSLSSGVTVNNLLIENGIAKVDFSESLNNVGGSCRVAAIRAQIEQTLRQFPTVKEVIISVNGNAAEALQP